MMFIVGQMLTLARDYRAISQEELARMLGMSQAQVAKIEAGLKKEVDENTAIRLVQTLGFPRGFFEQEEDLLGFGSSAYFYRKRATISAADRRRIHSLVNLLRIATKRVLPHVEIQPKRPLPSWDIENYGDRASNVARALRAHWHLPDGPIRDLTALVESAGVIVISCEFGHKTVDATSLRLAGMPPLIFMNCEVPGDRWRFTLAHELAHLVMHREPHDQMEIEADEFAGEFLVPAAELGPQLSKLPRVQVRDLLPFKRHWKVSIQALIFRAFEAEAITEAQKKSLFVRISQLNMRQVEPEAIERETPGNFARMFQTLTDTLHFNSDELASLLEWGASDMRALLPLPNLPPVRHLRAI
ncbi:XRE family transcriptional regulator [Ottowia thiooxydans]|uniref:Zn-dependent peptidase ImmA (M78 family)/DNA-binding XRE family transcriptional regulator n=1 Tax=Ottowia thiooxydans TaxID=219182 RepID=A0ABV2Q1T8_9BURK